MKKKVFNIFIEDRAKIEIADAYDWYEEQKEGLGDDFLNAFQNSLKTIQKAPNAYPLLKFHRQSPLKTFPFVILYEIDKDNLIIDAVFHTSKDPLKK